MLYFPFSYLRPESCTVLAQYFAGRKELTNKHNPDKWRGVAVFLKDRNILSHVIRTYFTIIVSFQLFRLVRVWPYQKALVIEKKEAGESLLSLLCSMVLFAFLLAATGSTFVNISRRALDHETMSRAEDEVKVILDLMAFEIRMAGAGMPLGQTGFPIGGAGLGTEPLPVLLTATASDITFRLNETGVNTVLTASFTPGLGNVFSVFSTAGLSIGDTIYISNMPAAGSSGLKGTIGNIAANNVTLAAGSIATAGAVFDSGSSVDKVTTITFNSPANWSGITRDDGTGALSLSPNSTFSISYLDTAGVALVLPLTDAVVKDNLSSILLQISVRGDAALADYTTYTATGQTQIAIRGLILARNS